MRDANLTFLTGVVRFVRPAGGDDLSPAGLVLRVRSEGPGYRDDVPCWLPTPDGTRVPELEVGDRVVVLGRTRLRRFRTGDRRETRTEILADRVEPDSDRARSELARSVSQALVETISR